VAFNGKQNLKEVNLNGKSAFHDQLKHTQAISRVVGEKNKRAVQNCMVVSSGYILKHFE